MELQWGRSLIPAEVEIVDVVEVVALAASMGPQFNPCGRCRKNRRIIGMVKLQWGPQFNPCGRLNGRLDPRRVWIGLQWGRSLIPAEGGLLASKINYTY